jgi:hypothetical protein
MVKFCRQCGSWLNHIINPVEKGRDDQGKEIILNPEGVLSYKCGQCGEIDHVVEKCLFVNELAGNAHDYQLSPNMIYDATLPRTKQLPCSNPQCPSRVPQGSQGVPQGNPEIIMFQYNPEMYNIGYMCSVCLHYWKNERKN